MGDLKSAHIQMALLDSPQLLIATNQLNESAFEKRVILLHEHTINGSKGLVINQPLETDLGKVLEKLNITSHLPKVNNKTIYLGGPVERGRGAILSFEKDDHLLEVNVKSQQSYLEEIAIGEGPEDFLIALGHTAWGLVN